MTYLKCVLLMLLPMAIPMNHRAGIKKSQLLNTLKNKKYSIVPIAVIINKLTMDCQDAL
jgi:hypothetical protein